MNMGGWGCPNLNPKALIIILTCIRYTNNQKSVENTVQSSLEMSKKRTLSRITKHTQ